MIEIFFAFMVGFSFGVSVCTLILLCRIRKDP